ncbi:MAG: hypothetical protein M1833_003095 [Piccolia ochrophora]|nr:MAG: hypothetical protein M1833_003095 [Piccolia ochrophora]
MGICSSCLGADRDKQQNRSSESARLLGDDPQQAQYGSLSAPPHGIAQVDPQDVQREEAALQSILAQTSDKLIDIFALHPQTGSPTVTSAFVSATDSKSRLYQNLLRQVTSSDALPRSLEHASDIGSDRDELPGACLDELEDTSTELKIIKGDQVGELVGGFASLEERVRMIRGSKR